MRIQIECFNCHSLFYREKSMINYRKKHGQNNYCSKSCQSQGLGRTSVYLTCVVCSKEFKKVHSELTKRPLYFCSRSCIAKYYGNLRLYNTKPRPRRGKTVEIECSRCHKTFRRIAGWINATRKDGQSSYCSKLCQHQSMDRSFSVSCKQCNKKIVRAPCQIKRCKNPFCSKSCASKYNMKHKNFGCNRSKLELLIESSIKAKFPNLQFNVNDRDLLIGIELDFYFPSLRFAIELNGITHYEPIYDIDKFNKTVARDKQKQQLCNEKGIELMVVDTSQHKHSNKSNQKYIDLVLDYIRMLCSRK
jgi:hypothetical protein